MKKQRQNKLIDYLQQHPLATMKELRSFFGTSMNTMRSDVQYLVEEGLVRKVYGGVEYVGNHSIYPPSETREGSNRTVKMEIARRAAQFVEDGDIIYIDYGTTTLNIPLFLEDRNDVTIITPNIPVVLKGHSFPNLKLIMLPGIVSNKEFSVMSENTVQDLENYNINKAFMANAGITKEGRLSVANYIQREIKKTALSISRNHYLLTESSKFREEGILFYGNLSQIETIITDSSLTYESRLLLEDNSVNIITV